MRRLAAILVLVLAAHGGELSERTAVRPLPTKTFRCQAVVVDRRIYVLGGWRRPVVWMTTVDAAGDLAPWQKVSTFPEKMPAEFGAATVLGNTVYWLGGRWNDPETNDHEDSPRVYRAQVAADGSLSAWEQTTPMPEGRISGVAFAHHGRVYYLAGEYRRRVWFAEQQADGALGNWQETVPLKSPRGSAGVAIYGDYLFVLGGMVLHQRFSDIVFRSQFREDGTLVKWRRSEPLPAALGGHATAVVDRDVFVFGGAGNEAGILASRVGDDLHLEDWRRLEPLPDRVSQAAAAVVGNHVFLIGGIRFGEERNHVYEDVWRWRWQPTAAPQPPGDPQ